MTNAFPRFLRRSAAVIAPIALANAALAQSPAAGGGPEPLTIGSKAPVPDIEKFVQGEAPAKWFEPGKVWVVEFWATWCGPCKVAMPHMSDLADKYGSKMVVVGVSDEEVGTVSEFMAKPEWKQKARYVIATDSDRSTHRQYMEAAGQMGIPTAFLVKDGTVQWIGHPMQIDEPLAKALDGTWDPAAFKQEFERKAEPGRKQMAQRALMAKARKSGDWAPVLAMMDQDIAAAEPAARAMMQVSKFKLMISDANVPADGYSLGREIVAANKGNAAVMNEVAWFVLDNAKVKQRDPAFAMQAAQAAVDASKGEDPAILDTMARACWESGDKAKAVEWQRKAIGLADEGMAAELKETLRKYEGGEAPAKKTALMLDGKDGTGAPAGGDAPAGPKGGSPGGAGDRPAGRGGSGRGPGGRGAPGASTELTPEAEKVFPPLAAEGFDSPEALVEYLPKAGNDAGGMLRLMRAQRSATDGGKIALRVAAALVEDMSPVVTASMKKFGAAAKPMMGVPNVGARSEIKMDGADRATLVTLDADGKPTGQLTGLVKADGKWFFDFDKSAGIDRDGGSSMAMMANMMGSGMRSAARKAAASTAKDIEDGKVASGEEATAQFGARMQQEMMASMMPPGAEGGPAGGGRAGGSASGGGRAGGSASGGGRAGGSSSGGGSSGGGSSGSEGGGGSKPSGAEPAGGGAPR
jgi:thiol-disulfide isomerase/thioredoxin